MAIGILSAVRRRSPSTSRFPKRPPGRRAFWRRVQIRRAIAVLLAAVAGWAAVTALAPADPPREPALVAVEDLPAGHRISPSDVRIRQLESGTTTPDRLTEAAGAVGQSLATAVSAGEVLTPVRLRPARALTGLPAGDRALHVPIADTGAVALVRPGDRVDLFAVASGVIAGENLLVLAVDAEGEGRSGLTGGGPSEGPGVVLAVPTTQISKVVAAGTANGEGVQLALRSDP